MITLYPFNELGHKHYDWLNAHYHFSFSSYYNQNRLGFGTLKVINDDIIQPHKGFDMHSHDNMEIITYVRKGAISHKDSLGNSGRTEAGDVQVMSAGSGITHSEYNLEDTETQLYQIWITSNRKDVEPRWDMKSFPKSPIKDKLHILVSGNENDQEALFIYQNAKIYSGFLLKETKIEHIIQHQAYILASKGRFKIDNIILNEGDGAEITDINNFIIEALEDCEILVIDAPKV